LQRWRDSLGTALLAPLQQESRNLFDE